MKTLLERLRIAHNRRGEESSIYLDAIQALEEPPTSPDGWVSVSERLPEEGVYVLTWNGSTRWIDCLNGDIWENRALTETLTGLVEDDEMLEEMPTHWRPLPPPPPAEKE